jgi:conjugal transfer pilin signal peptidase TrbI
MLNVIRNNEFLFLFVAAAFFACYKCGYANNVTQSLPHKHFFIYKTKNIKNGDYILFSAPTTSLYAGMKLIKQVVGISGDKVAVMERDVFVNEKLIGVAKTRAKNGTALRVTQDSQIPKGRYFVANSHVDSYDSRYLDFGLIDEKDIIGVAFAIW